MKTKIKGKKVPSIEIYSVKVENLIFTLGSMSSREHLFSSGNTCYTRYLPDYSLEETLSKNSSLTVYDVKLPPPAAECVLNEIVFAERQAFWRCYFDIHCSAQI